MKYEEIKLHDELQIILIEKAGDFTQVFEGNVTKITNKKVQLCDLYTIKRNEISKLCKK